MKKLLLLLILGMFCFSFVSAFDFDNIVIEKPISLDRSYDLGNKIIPYNDLWEEYKPVEIENAYGLPLIGSTLYKDVLTQHSFVCGGNNLCEDVWEAQLYTDGALLDDIKYERILDDGSRVQGQVRWQKLYVWDNPIEEEQYYTEKECSGATYDEEGKQLTEDVCNDVEKSKVVYYKMVDTYKQVCNKVFSEKNQTSAEVCEDVVSGQEKQYYDGWREYSLGEVLPADNYKVKLVAEKRADWVIDYIPVILGKEIKSRAVWGVSDMTSNLVAHYKMNSRNFTEKDQTNVTDSTGVNNGTYVGRTFNNGVATNVSISDGAMSYDGSTSRLYANISNANNPVDFTYSFWYYANSNSTTAGNNPIISKRDTNNQLIITIMQNSSNSNFGKIVINSYNQTGSLSGLNSNSLINNSNQWYHVVVSYVNSSHNFSYYVNGVYDKSSTTGFVGDLYSSYNGLTNIGYQSTGTNLRLNGSLDNVMIYNRSLSSSEISALYSAGRTKYAQNNLGLVAQYSGRDYAGTPSAPTTIYDTNHLTDGKINQGFGFDGVGNYVNISNSNFIFLNKSGLYSFSTWIKPLSNTTGAIFQKSTGSTDRNGLYYESGDVRFGYYNGSSYTSKHGTVILNQWNHVIGINNNGIISLYVNSIEQTSSGSLPSFAGTNDFKIGSGTATGNSYFNGSIDDVRIYNRSLSASEIAYIYNSGVGTESDPNAYVTLNSPTDNSISYYKNTTTSASANVTGGAYLTNLTLYDNSTGTWGARNTSSLFQFGASGLVSYYKLDEPSGVNVYDTLNTYGGWLISGTQNQVGKINKSYLFNGVSDYINFSAFPNIEGTNPRTIFAWIYPTATDNERVIYGYGTASSNTNFVFKIDGGNLSLGGYGAGDFKSNIFIPTNEWNFVGITFDSTNLTLFKINSTGKYQQSATKSLNTGSTDHKIGRYAYTSAGYFSGNIDELSIWNRTLTNAEITQMYNNGAGQYPGTFPTSGTQTFTNNYVAGQSYLWNYQGCDTDGVCGFATSNRTFSIDSVSPTITLNYPTSLIDYGAINGTLQLNLTATDTNLANVWYDYNGTNVTILGALSGVVNLSNITLSTKKNITIYANDTAGNLKESNFSWDYRFVEYNRIYNLQTYETSNENYTVIFNSSTNVLSGNAIFYYNGSSYSSNVSCTGFICNATANIDIPLLSGASAENKSFYWQITTYNGSNSYTFNTDVSIQTVNPLTLTSCSGTNVSINFTSYDEQTRVRLNPFDFQGNFEYYTGLGAIHKDLVISNTSAPYVALCTNVNTTYYIDSTITYAAPAYTTQGSSTTIGNSTQSTTTVNASFNYPTRTYYYQKYPINQNTQNVSLLLLGSTSSTNFLLNVLDSALRPVDGVLVNAQRCYSGINTTGNNNITVFISKTDINGYTSGNLEIYTGQYQFFITNQSNTLLSVIPCSAVSPQSTPYTLTFKIGQTYQSPFTNVENLTDITGGLEYNYTTNKVVLTYVDTSTTFIKAELIVRQLNASGSYQNITCDSNSTLSSGIITCDISNEDSYTATAYIYRTDRKLVDQITFTYQNNSDALGYYGVFLGMFLLIIGAFIFKFNELAAIWIEFAIIVFCNMTGLIAFGNVFITAYFCIALIISAVLER